MSTAIPPSIRVLHVDDEPGFAEMAGEFIERTDGSISVETATSVSEGFDRLTQQEFDCIVSDHDMPGKNGIEFLTELRERYADLPFILFTGKGSEEIASDAISAGVTDYLQKEGGTDQYAVLANRIVNASEAYRAEQSLKRRKAQDEAIAAFSRDALNGVEIEKLFENAVALVSDRLGCEYADILERTTGESVLNFVTGAGWDPTLIDSAVVTGGNTSPAGFALSQSEPVIAERYEDDGRFETPPILGENGITSGVVATIGSTDDPWGVLEAHSTSSQTYSADDVRFVQNMANILGTAIERHATEQKLRESESRFREIAELSPDTIFRLDTDGKFQYVSPAIESLLGYTPDELLGTTFQEYVASSSIDTAIEGFSRVVSGEVVRKLDITLRDAQDSAIEIELSANPVQVDSEVELVQGFAREVTERKERERELETKNQAMDAAPVGITITDPSREDNPIIYANDKFTEVTGYPRDEILGRNCRFLQGPKTDADAVADLRDAIDSETPVTAELVNYRKDGTKFWNRVSVAPVHAADGTLRNYVGFQQDITESKAREQELAQVSELLDRTERIADVGGWEIDTETEEVYWTENLFDLLGVEYDEEPSLEEALDLYHDEDRSIIAQAVEDALDTGDPFDVEVRLRRPNGDVRWVRVQGVPSTANDEVVTLRGAFQDVTDRRSRERVLREMYEIISDRERSFEDQVAALLELGCTELDTKYGTLSEIRGDEYVFEVVAADDESISAGDVVPLSVTNCEITASTKQTRVLADIDRDAPEQTDRAGFAEWGISCYLGAPVFLDEEVYGTFCFFDREARAEQFTEWEVTLVDLMGRWVSSELQRREALDHLREQNERLDQFTSIVSHDLRNPVSVADGSIDLAIETGDRDHLSRARAAVDRMDTLIEDLLTLAREGTAVTETSSTNLAAVIEECWQTVDTRDATLVENVDGSILADESRVKQMFENVIRNAIDHGGEAVTITIGKTDTGFFVEDDGPGIPAADRGDVFDAGFSTSEDGTGFGLSIVERIVDAHNWNICATESSSGGARFEITGVDFTTG